MANNKKKQKTEDIILTTTSDEMKRLIKILIIVFIIFLLFLGITYFVTKEEELINNNNNNNAEVTIQYDEILVGEILNQKNNKYYVLAYKEDDQYVSLYNSYLDIYKNKSNSSRIYTSNLDNIFNIKYIADNSNLDISHIKDIKFKGSTLLEIEDREIINYYEEKEAILTFLKELIK